MHPKQYAWLLKEEQIHVFRKGLTASFGNLPWSTSFLSEGGAIFGRGGETIGRRRERDGRIIPYQDKSSAMAFQTSVSSHRPTALQCRHRMMIWQPFGTSKIVPAAALI